MKKALSLLACLFLAIPCQAQIIIVDDDGPADFNNIQAAIDSANDGDTIIVQPGTYYENVRMKNGVTVQGSGAEVTTINGGENGHVVVFNLASGTISGFTITNSGQTPPYSAGVFTSQCSVTISDNIIVNNANGIKVSSNSTAIIVRNRIMNNTSIFGKGIHVSSSIATITNNIIANNNTNGGIYCSDSSPAIINNTIANNTHYGIRCCPLSTQSILNNIITCNEYGIMALVVETNPLFHCSILLTMTYGTILRLITGQNGAASVYITQV